MIRVSLKNLPDGGSELDLSCVLGSWGNRGVK
jgi:hypothetical protein